MPSRGGQPQPDAGPTHGRANLVTCDECVECLQLGAAAVHGHRERRGKRQAAGVIGRPEMQIVEIDAMRERPVNQRRRASRADVTVEIHRTSAGSPLLHEPARGGWGAIGQRRQRRRKPIDQALLGQIADVRRQRAGVRFADEAADRIKIGGHQGLLRVGFRHDALAGFVDLCAVLLRVVNMATSYFKPHNSATSSVSFWMYSLI